VWYHIQYPQLRGEGGRIAMLTPAVLGVALFISGLGISEDCWKHREREPVSSWILVATLVIGGLGLVAYEINYWINYWLS